MKKKFALIIPFVVVGGTAMISNDGKVEEVEEIAQETKEQSVGYPVVTASIMNEMQKGMESDDNGIEYAEYIIAEVKIKEEYRGRDRSGKYRDISEKLRKGEEVLIVTLTAEIGADVLNDFIGVPKVVVADENNKSERTMELLKREGSLLRDKKEKITYGIIVNIGEKTIVKIKENT